MFSPQQKREISDKVQEILRKTNHPNLPKGEIRFYLEVFGQAINYYDIIENKSVQDEGGE